MSEKEDSLIPLSKKRHRDDDVVVNNVKPEDGNNQNNNAECHRRYASSPMEYIQNIVALAPRPEWLHPINPTLFGKERDHILNLAIRICHKSNKRNNLAAGEDTTTTTTTMDVATTAALAILEMAPHLALQRMPVAPLILAAQRGNHALVQILLEHYWADPNDCTTDGATAVLQAAHFGHVSILHILMQNGASMDQPNFNHTTPLMRAAQEGHYHCVRFLLETGHVINVNKRNRQGMTALMLASQRGHASIVKLLIEKAHAQLDIPTIPNRSTALLLACKRGHLNVVQVLVEHGCEIFVVDAKRRTVRDIVRKHVTHPDVARSILELCIDPLNQITAMRRAAARKRNWELCKLWHLQKHMHTDQRAEQKHFFAHEWKRPDTIMIHHITQQFPLPLLIQVANYLPLPPMYSRIIAILTARCSVAPNSAIETALDILDEILEDAGILKACDECHVPLPTLPRTLTGIASWSELHRFCLIHGNCESRSEQQHTVEMTTTNSPSNNATDQQQQQQLEAEEEDGEENEDEEAGARVNNNVVEIMDNADGVRNDVAQQHPGQQERTNITTVAIAPLPEFPNTVQFRRHVGYPRLLAANPLLVSSMRNRTNPRIPPQILHSIVNIADVERIVRRCGKRVEGVHLTNHQTNSYFAGIRFEPSVAMDIVMLLSRLASYQPVSS